LSMANSTCPRKNGGALTTASRVRLIAVEEPLLVGWRARWRLRGRPPGWCNAVSIVKDLCDRPAVLLSCHNPIWSALDFVRQHLDLRSGQRAAARRTEGRH